MKRRLDAASSTVFAHAPATTQHTLERMLSRVDRTFTVRIRCETDCDALQPAKSTSVRELIRRLVRDRTLPGGRKHASQKGEDTLLRVEGLSVLCNFNDRHKRTITNQAGTDHPQVGIDSPRGSLWW